MQRSIRGTAHLPIERTPPRSSVLTRAPTVLVLGTVPLLLPPPHSRTAARSNGFPDGRRLGRQRRRRIRRGRRCSLGHAWRRRGRGRSIPRCLAAAAQPERGRPRAGTRGGPTPQRPCSCIHRYRADPTRQGVHAVRQENRESEQHNPTAHTAERSAAVAAALRQECHGTLSLCSPPRRDARLWPAERSRAGTAQAHSGD